MGQILYTSVKLTLGTLYPAYCSFKAVKTKNVKEYVHWMTYWIVLALWTLLEEVLDILLSFWWPLYFESKILVLIWILSPATRGSSLIYRQLVHPCLASKEDEIDLLLERWRQQSYHLGLKYTKVAAQKITTTVLETAIKGGGGLVDSLRHSYSLSDLRRSESEGVGRDRYLRGRQEKTDVYIQEGEVEPGYIREIEEDAVYMREGGTRNRAMVRSWHVGSPEETITHPVEPIERGGRGGQRRPRSMTLTSEGDCGSGSGDEAFVSRRRGSGRSNLPPRPSSLYGTLPRSRATGSRPLARKARSPIPDQRGGGSLKRTVSSTTFKKEPGAGGAGAKIAKPVRPKRGNSKPKQESAESEVLEKVAESEVIEEDFSMTYSEKEGGKVENKRKCEIS